MDRADQRLLKRLEPLGFRLGWALATAALPLAGCAATGPGSGGQAGGLAKAEAVDKADATKTVVEQGHGGLTYAVRVASKVSCLAFKWATVGEGEPGQARPVVLLEALPKPAPDCEPLDVGGAQTLELVVTRANGPSDGLAQGTELDEVGRISLEPFAITPGNVVAFAEHDQFYGSVMLADETRSHLQNDALDWTCRGVYDQCHCLKATESPWGGVVVECEGNPNRVHESWMCVPAPGSQVVGCPPAASESSRG